MSVERKISVDIYSIPLIIDLLPIIVEVADRICHRRDDQLPSTEEGLDGGISLVLEQVVDKVGDCGWPHSLVTVEGS